MLFHSYAFLLGFLPAALLAFHALRRFALERAALAALVAFSLAFYAWWNPVYLLLLVPLTLATFFIARAIARCRHARPRTARALMVAGVAGNLLVLAWFKYANFLVDNAAALVGAQWTLAKIVLPLGISFFVFQKIAFLVDAERGEVDRFDLLEFALFVSFFPQLIAGPIVHHAEVLPQLRARPREDDTPLAALGLTIFAIGLAKKVLFADSAAAVATPAFDAAAAGATLGAASAWLGALAYTAQLYFDFSGYSDMAIGAALLFGIRLPVNFASPYRATSIAEFWRRWHMTLSRFLRDYLYVPLGGNRRGAARRTVNLVLTMLLGGLWHGAAWTFVAWGALHGAYLVVHRAWQHVRTRVSARPAGRLEVLAGAALTFVAVVVGWVLFRAADLPTAFAILRSMAGGSAAAATVDVAALPAPDARAVATVATLLAVAFFAPNTQQITGYRGPSDTAVERGASDAAFQRGPTAPPARTPAWRWRPTPAWASASAIVAAAAMTNLSRVSEFLYFQF
jgi:D-alanyl-lipoteichoic acid acyltransferase DltB (MBOAT superfamily)